MMENAFILRYRLPLSISHIALVMQQFYLRPEHRKLSFTKENHRNVPDVCCNLQQSVIHLNEQQSRVGTESAHG